MAKKLGNEELLYIATTLPTVLADKDDAAYNLLSNLKTFRLGVESDQIDGGDKDSGSFGDPYPGRKNVPIEFSYNRQFNAPTAQAAIETAALATTAAGAELWWIKTTGVAGDRGRHGKMRVLGHNLTSDDQQLGEITITAQNIGAYTTFTEA